VPQLQKLWFRQKPLNVKAFWSSPFTRFGTRSLFGIPELSITKFRSGCSILSMYLDKLKEEWNVATANPS
jgi:hypothetical protein